MRQVGFTDICHAARVVMQTPRPIRAMVCDQLIAEADAADRFRKRLGRGHPAWGSGTLSSAAIRHDMAPEPSFCAAQYAGSLALVFERLAVWRRFADRHRLCKSAEHSRL